MTITMTTCSLTRWMSLVGLVTCATVGAAEPIQRDQTESANTCSVRVADSRVTLESPAFTFTLDTSEGLRAVSWGNRLTGAR